MSDTPRVDDVIAPYYVSPLSDLARDLERENRGLRQAERKAFIRGLREAARMARKYGYKPMAHDIEAEADRLEGMP